VGNQEEGGRKKETKIHREQERADRRESRHDNKTTSVEGGRERER